MDQPTRPDDSSSLHGDPQKQEKVAARAHALGQLKRAGLVLIVLAAIALIWNGVAAHRAAARLRASTEAQAIVTV